LHSHQLIGVAAGMKSPIWPGGRWRARSRCVGCA